MVGRYSHRKSRVVSSLQSLFWETVIGIVFDRHIRKKKKLQFGLNGPPLSYFFGALSQ